MKLTQKQLRLAKLLSEGHTYADIGKALDLAAQTIKVYTEDIAAMIRGNLPAKTKVVVWYRLTNNLSVFTGEPLSDSNTPQ